MFLIFIINFNKSVNMVKLGRFYSRDVLTNVNLCSVRHPQLEPEDDEEDDKPHFDVWPQTTKNGGESGLTHFTRDFKF